MSTLRVLVTGSREWSDADVIRRRLGAIPFVEPEFPVLIHGGARGADRLAATVGTELGFDVQVFPADWDTHGKRAGILRNLQMLDQAPHVVLAFRVNGSRGTTHCIKAAKKRGIPVEVFDA